MKTNAKTTPSIGSAAAVAVEQIEAMTRPLARSLRVLRRMPEWQLKPETARQVAEGLHEMTEGMKGKKSVALRRAFESIADHLESCARTAEGTNSTN